MTRKSWEIICQSVTKELMDISMMCLTTNAELALCQKVLNEWGDNSLSSGRSLHEWATPILSRIHGTKWFTQSNKYAHFEWLNWDTFQISRYAKVFFKDVIRSHTNWEVKCVIWTQNSKG